MNFGNNGKINKMLMAQFFYDLDATDSGGGITEKAVAVAQKRVVEMYGDEKNGVFKCTWMFGYIQAVLDLKNGVLNEIMNAEKG